MSPWRERRRLWFALASCVLVVAVVVALVDDASVHDRLGNTRQELEADRAAASRAAADLRSTLVSLRSTLQTKDLRTLQLDALTSELTSAKSQLASASGGLALGKLSVADIGDCLTGVEQAIGAVAQGSSALATAELGSASAACENIFGTESGGPVYPFDFADPDVLAYDGSYYAYGTNSSSGNVQVLQSQDLVHWTPYGDALPSLPSWANKGDTWAPSVVFLGGQFRLYYTVAAATTGTQCISVASSTSPVGPFIDESTGPIECQPTKGGSIDPDPYFDSTGKPYLSWKSIGNGSNPPTIWAQALEPSGTSLATGTPTQLITASETWEGGIVEAPSMLLYDGTYYLFYSGNNWNSASYAIGVALCNGPTGPCTKPLGGPLYSSQSNLAGPGGESVFVGLGGRLEIAFHAWLPGAVGYPNPRLLFIRELAVKGGMPAVVPPG